MTAAGGGQKKPKLQGASGAKTHLRWNWKTAQDPLMVKCSHSAPDEGLAAHRGPSSEPSED